MKHGIVYGPGCKRCDTTAEMVKEAAGRIGAEVTVTKETDMARISMAGVMSTPGISIDGKLVHAGGLPDASALEGWLKG